jgi:hypothetical protein
MSTVARSATGRMNIHAPRRDEATTSQASKLNTAIASPRLME